MTAMQRQKPPWSGEHKLIAHALGSIDGKRYTNSKEALTRSYDRGFRLFEVDVALATDGEPVLIHGWRPTDFVRLGWDSPTGEVSAPMASTEFRKARIHGKFTTMLLEDLRDFLTERPDTAVLFDIRPQSRERTADIYTKIASVINDPSLQNRCMAGAYSAEMVDEVQSLADFSRINLFHGNREDRPRLEVEGEFLEFCISRGIETVTLDPKTSDSILNSFANAGIATIVFTVNDPSTAVALLERGATLIGTDNISPESLKRAGQYSYGHTPYPRRP